MSFVDARDVHPALRTGSDLHKRLKAKAQALNTELNVRWEGRLLIQKDSVQEFRHSLRESEIRRHLRPTFQIEYFLTPHCFYPGTDALHGFRLIPFAGILTVMAVLAGESPAAAPGDGQDPVMSGLMNEFIGWISAQSNLEPCPVPAVRYATCSEIVQRWYGKTMPKGTPMKVLALYEYPTKTIYLCVSFDPGALLDKSILLHEIVHHLQDCNDVDFPCHAASEPQAYELQARWLEGQGVEDPWALMKVDRFTVYGLSIPSD